MKALPLLILGTLMFSACDKRKDTTVIIETQTPPATDTKTLETRALGTAINTYDKAPTAENAADVKRAFAELDGEIAELEGHVSNKTGDARAEALKKLNDLTAYRTSETARFTAIQTAKGIVSEPRPVEGRTAGDDLKDAADKIGNSVEKGAKNVGEAIKDATN